MIPGCFGRLPPVNVELSCCKCMSLWYGSSLSRLQLEQRHRSTLLCRQTVFGHKLHLRGRPHLEGPCMLLYHLADVEHWPCGLAFGKVPLRVETSLHCPECDGGLDPMFDRAIDRPLRRHVTESLTRVRVLLFGPRRLNLEARLVAHACCNNNTLVRVAVHPAPAGLPGSLAPLRLLVRRSLNPLRVCFVPAAVAPANTTCVQRPELAPPRV